jgi:putative hydrolase of the HAD superfamily
VSGFAVSLDLDETLLDNSFIPHTIAACCEFVATRLGIDVATVARANADAWSAYWLANEAGVARGSPNGEELRRAVWGTALASCGCDDAVVLEALLHEHVRLDEAGARLFDDVGPEVDALRRDGVRLALITNGASDTQRSRLETLGIAPWFDAVIISAEVGAVKPDAAIFDLAASGLGVAGHELWHVGDNLVTDVGGAQAAGHRAVWINRRGHERTGEDPTPDLELPSLSGLLAAITVSGLS